MTPPSVNKMLQAVKLSIEVQLKSNNKETEEMKEELELKETPRLVNNML